MRNLTVESYLPEVAQIMRNPARETGSTSGQSTLALETNFCVTCTSPTFGYLRCIACNKHRQAYDGELADNVACISYAGGTAQSESDFYQYKKARGHESAMRRLGILMVGFTSLHSGCFRHRSGQKIDSIVHVPSGRAVRQAVHPLATLMEYFPLELRTNSVRYTGPLRTARATEIHPDYFQFDSSPEGQHVMIIEDTWVQGLNAQSVAVRAKRDGASTVSILAIGRQLNRGWSQHKQWLDSPMAAEPFDPYFCPVTRSNHADLGQ